MAMCLTMSYGQYFGEGDYQLYFTNVPLWEVSDGVYEAQMCDFTPGFDVYFTNNAEYKLKVVNEFGVEAYNSESAYNSHLITWFHTQEDLIFIAEDTDTIGVLRVFQMPVWEVDSISLSLGGHSNNGGVELVEDNLLLCSFLDVANVYLNTVIYTGICDNPYFGNGDLKYYKNGTPFFSGSFKGSDLNDGDTLWSELTYVDAYMVQSPCECVFVNEPLVSPKIIVRKGEIGTYSFPESQVAICPGDTLSLDDQFAFAKYKYYGPETNMSWYYGSYGHFKITEPMKVRAEVYPESRTACWSVTDTVEFVLGQDCQYGLVRGRIFDDKDGNKVINSGEPFLQNRLVTIEPGPHYLFQEGSFFKKLLPVGEKYKFTFKEDGWASDTVLVDFSNPDTFNLNDELLIPAFPLRDNDLQVEVSSTRMRPGFEMTYYIDVRNNSYSSIYAPLELEIDTLLTDLEFAINPSYKEKGLIKWSSFYLNGQSTKRFTVKGKLPADIELLGTEVVSVAKYDYETDSYPANNIDTIRTLITGSFDPNDKQVFTDNGKAKTFISDSTDLEYLIRFQNTGTDTAFTVRVIDTLSPLHDISTFKMIAASHNYSLEIKGENVLVWTFSNILLPDSIVDEPGSHGFIKFTVEQKKENEWFTEINNKAYIYFDFNPAVITNETSVTVGEEFVITGYEKKKLLNNIELSIYPNPARQGFKVEADVKGILQVFDLTGALIMSEKFSKEKYIPTENMQTGTYLIKIENEEGLLSKKIIISQNN